MLLLNRKFDLQDYVNVRETCLLLGDWREAECLDMPCWRNCLWYTSSRQAKRLGSSAQRQLMTYPRQIFVVLEGLCWKPSMIHLGRSPGKYSNEYAVSSDTLGGLQPWAGKTQGEQQQPDGCRTHFHALPKGQYRPCSSSREARNHWRSARRKVRDHRHVDVLIPKSKTAGSVMNGIFLHLP